MYISLVGCINSGMMPDELFMLLKFEISIGHVRSTGKISLPLCSFSYFLMVLNKVSHLSHTYTHTRSLSCLLYTSSVDFTLFSVTNFNL